MYFTFLCNSPCFINYDVTFCMISRFIWVNFALHKGDAKKLILLNCYTVTVRPGGVHRAIILVSLQVFSMTHQLLITIFSNNKTRFFAFKPYLWNIGYIVLENCYYDTAIPVQRQRKHKADWHCFSFIHKTSQSFSFIHKLLANFCIRNSPNLSNLVSLCNSYHTQNCSSLQH